MPDNHDAGPNLTYIKERADLLRDLRQYFDQRGFLEVQPPCLSRDCVVDAYIDPIEIERRQLSLADQTLPAKYIFQTSPELSMKRMLAAGAPSIYSIGPVFRAGELGPYHNVEFTMLEWYEVETAIHEGIQLLGDLVVNILGATTFDVVTYRELFSSVIGLDPIEADLLLLQQAVANIDSELAESVGDDRDALLDVLLSERIQPQLGIPNPVIVRDYPITQAALAKPSGDDPDCALRFELFANGIELANGYDELLDADELIRRTERENLKRANSNRKKIRLPNTLVQSMLDGLPQCTGVALGVDRLLMLRTKANRIDQVMPFTTQNA